jgi:heat shock 70kDa protein 1/2/6/8
VKDSLPAILFMRRCAASLAALFLLNAVNAVHPLVSSRRLSPDACRARRTVLYGYGPLAEDRDDEGNEYGVGMSIVSRDVLLDEFSPGGGPTTDVAALLSDWQEELAIADDGSKPLPSATEQEAMMASWRLLIDSKEKALRRTRAKKLRKAFGETWAPAHLTGWRTAEDGGLNAPSPLDDDEDDAVDALLEAEADGADEADDEFVRAWQTIAEREREDRERQSARAQLASRVTPEPLQMMTSWLLQGGRRRKGSTGAVADEIAIGIDLGTTNCAVAYIDANGRPVIIPAADGARILPSVISFASQEPLAGGAEALPPLLLAARANVSARVLVGAPAQRQRVTNPHSTYSSTKRLIGRTASSSELKALAALDVPYSVAGRAEGGREVLLACPALRRAISPVDAAAELVRAMILQARRTLGENAAKRAVVTVPAYFDDSQRLATETACLLAGLEEVKLLREPEAAALLYALDARTDARVMVFDLGGGTFDVSILDVGAGVVEVIASAGDPRLGGDDWDRALADWLENTFIQEHGVPLDGFARRRLIDAAEEAKVYLSTQPTTQIELPALAEGKGLNITLSRRKFEALTRSLLLRLVPPMREAARMAGLPLDESNMGTLLRGDVANLPPGVQQWQKEVAWRWRRMARRAGSTGSFPLGDVPISKVILVGGATRMPAIGRFIKRVTGLAVRHDARVNPDEAVALGAAVMAGILDGTVEQKVMTLNNPYQHSRAARKLADDLERPKPLYGI